MAQPFAATVSLSSAGVSPGMLLDPTARVTQVVIDLGPLNTSTGAGTSDVIIQATLDTWTAGGVTPVWTNISTSHYSSASYPSVPIQTIASPIAGLRLSSSTYAGGLAAVTLKALQTIIG